MTRKEMELKVQQLLLQQREFARLGLKLPPDKLLLLQRLLYRLGYNRGIPMSRKNTGNHPSPCRYSATKGDRANLFRQIADNPEHGLPGSDMRLIAADAVQELGDEESAKQLREYPGPIIGYSHGGSNGAQLFLGHGNGVYAPIHYPLGTPSEVIHALNQAHRTQEPVSIHLGETIGDEAGRDWLEERTRGRVGHAMGNIRYPLLFRPNAGFGDAISGLVRIRDGSGRDLYRHPNYHHGEITVGPGWKGVNVGVYRDGKPHAGFADEKKARQWIKRMGLKVTEKPQQMSRTTSPSFSQEKRRRYTRFTIQPGESLMGGQDFIHEVHDEEGNRVGHVWVTPKEDGTLNINHGGMNEHVPNGTGFTAIRQLVPQLKAMYPNHTRITGLRVSGSNPGRRSSVPMQRLPVKVIKYAKVDGHVPAHPLVAGFPIEQALRHLANDSKNAPELRDTAKTVLTKGDPTGLWALNDLLQEHTNPDGTQGHPLHKAYNWMSAADKVQLDKHTQQVLTDIANNSKVGVPTAYHGEFEYTPEHHVIAAARGLRKGDARADEFLRRDRQLLNQVRQGVSRLAHDMSPAMIDESIRRHAHRAYRKWGEKYGNGATTDHFNEQALKPIEEASTEDPDHEKTVRATRYRRLPANKVSMSLPVKVIKYAMTNRSDFIDALRRIKSSNQKAMHEAAQHVAKTIGMEPMKVFDALHDTPQGSVPGVAQAIYGKASPEQLHAAAAWMGLTGSLPGVAVFHPRPTGPDVLHRFRINGSGLDARAKLDRAGLKSRIIIPHRKGVDVLIPDVGGKLTGNVQQFADQHKVQLEASPGHFSTIGSADQARARELFRNKVTQQEQGGM